MTEILTRLRNWRLGLKLNLLLVVVFAVLLVTMLFAIYINVLNFTAQTGQQRVTQEMDLITKRMAEQERDLLQTVALLAVRPGMQESLNQNNMETLSAATAAGASQLGLDRVVIVNANGDPILLVTDGISHVVKPAQDGATSATSSDEINLLTLGLSGMRPIGAVASTISGSGNGPKIRLAAALPLQAPDVASQINGAVLGTRMIDSQMLNQIDFGRDDVHVALIRDNRIVSQDDTEPGAAENDQALNGVALDPVLVNQALSGKTSSLDHLFYAANRIPFAIGYMPFTVNNKVAGVLVVQIRMDQLVTFGYQLAAVLTSILALLAAFVLYGVSRFTRRLVTQPLGSLRSVAALMREGDYSQRIQVGSQDEIGELGNAFNQMAETIQNRQLELERINSTLEQRVKDRTIEFERARDEAERSNNVKSAFLASMSHELRTPLNAIINFTKFVAKGSMGPVNDEQRETLSEVIDSAKHLLNLINDVLDMSKIEAGSLTLFVEPNIDLKAILDMVAATGKTLLAGKPVELKIDVPGALPSIKGDRQRILQILLNILSNACKFTEEGTVCICASGTQDEIVVSVKDTGPGIPTADQALVFEAFKQTTTGLRQGGGTGLGMPISRSLAEAHGGRLWLTSEPGKGSVFYVALPIKSDLLKLSVAI